MKNRMKNVAIYIAVALVFFTVGFVAADMVLDNGDREAKKLADCITKLHIPVEDC